MNTKYCAKRRNEKLKTENEITALIELTKTRFGF